MTDQPSEQSSGFWTLTRPSKLSKRRNSDLHELHHKVFNICVVGLSGTEKDKGPIGIGKSCLCNRFVRSAADDYFTDHISVLSQSDFGGHVVNNDHWLYWGSVIKSCDGYDLAFNVIEQTEFVDDVCFQPFKSGKTEPYYKRCANTKLVSAEKLMYICKSQLGIEREYEQRYLPDGKFNVDGFLCLFDVSQVHGRNIDKQIEMTNLILLNLIKTRKPVVFVTTKHDEASDLLLAEAERLVNQRDFRGLVPIVETSAQENVNINMAFLICAQLIDKSRAKLRVPPYFEAYRSHIELLKAASDAYLGLIRSTVHDHRSSWQQICIKLSHNPEFLQYTYLHGLDRASLLFKEHIKRLHEDCINQKMQTYLKIFPDILEELLPRNNRAINNNNTNPAELTVIDRLNSSSSPQIWEEAKEYIRNHPLFNKYFVQLPDGVAWYDTELLQSNDNRLPSDWLNSKEAYAIFQQRNHHLEVEQRRQFARETFAQMLINLKIPVGKPFIELKHVFTGSVELEVLNDQELFEIYVDYQNNLLQQARADFQELLLENAEHLHHLTSSDKVIRQEDIKTINAILQHDERYQALDRFDQDRTLMMIRHLSFLHSQISEQCPSYPKCVEPEVERLLITKAKALVNRFYENKPDKTYLNSQKICDLVIFGPRRPSQQLILALNVLNSRAPKNGQYQITFTVFDNCDDVDAQIHRFRQSNAKPKGCFGIFTNTRSLEHVSFTLEKFLMLNNSQAHGEKDYFGGPPIVMLYAADITLDERTMLALENEGQQISDKFKCPFMNVTAIDQYRQHQQNNIRNNDQDSASQVMSECASLDYACVDAAFNVLKEAISRRVCFMELYNNQDLIPRQAFNPDARILLCILCGEPFSNEQFLWRMFLASEHCYVTSSKSICVKMKSEKGQDRFIGITITSYTHGAFNYRDDLLHGFILACSMQRKASLSVLNAFSFNIPCTPVLVIAVDDVGNLRDDTKDDKDDEISYLIEEAQAAADRLKGNFELLNLSREDLKQDARSSDDFKLIENFIRNVFRRKPAIDRAYQLGDNEPQATLSEPNNVQSGFAGSKLMKANERRHLKTQLEPAALISDDENHAGVDALSTDHRERGSSALEHGATNSVFMPAQYSTCEQLQQPQPQPRSQMNTRKFINKNGQTNSDAQCCANLLKRFSIDNDLQMQDLAPAPAFNEAGGAPCNDNHQNNNPSKLTNFIMFFENSQYGRYSCDNSLVSKVFDTGNGSTATVVNKKLKGNNDFVVLRSSLVSPNIDCHRDGNSLSKLMTTSAMSAVKAATCRLDTPSLTTPLDKVEANQQQGKSVEPPKPAPRMSLMQTIAQSENSSDSLKSDKVTKNRVATLKREIFSVKLQTSEIISRNKHKLQNILDHSQQLTSQPKTQMFNQSTTILDNHHHIKRHDLARKLPPIPIAQQQGRRDVHRVASSVLGKSNELSSDEDEDEDNGHDEAEDDNDEDEENDGIEEEEDYDGATEDSTDNRLDKPRKPGKLDLRQFDNITTAIGKLNVQPLSASPTSIATISQTTSPPTTSVSSSALTSNKSSAISKKKPVSDTHTPNSRRLNNLRHGRAVAPPKLPTNLLFKNSLTRLGSNEKSSQNRMAQSNDEESAIDFSQSPIAQRLLKHSKDYKVSELNSPNESDSEPHQARSHVIKELLKASKNEKSASARSTSMDTSELISSRGETIRQLNEILAKKPPGPLGANMSKLNRGSSNDQLLGDSTLTSNAKKGEKDSKKDKKKIRSDEKLEKRKLKEEERLRRQEEEKQRRQEKKLASKKSKSGVPNIDSLCDDGIPLFIKCCIEFIESEGLDAEGIYRVPGNRAHVDAFVQKFKENPEMSILESDIPVNAVATALKDFLSKKWGPIIPLGLMNELTELSHISDKNKRVEAVKELVNKLPTANYKLLKYVFSHFVKVSSNNTLNSMDSKNLAICWWPTLLPLHFNDMVMFEQMRPHLEESIQTMIDRYDFIFAGEEPEIAT